jgi:hypothetical protein
MYISGSGEHPVSHTEEVMHQGCYFWHPTLCCHEKEVKFRAKDHLPWGTVAYPCNPVMREAEIGGSWFETSLGKKQVSETPSQRWVWQLTLVFPAMREIEAGGF